jgi:hypothetical protein
MLLSNKQEAPVNITGESDFVPVRMLEVEIGQPLPDVSAFDEKTGRHYQRAWSLVRLHTPLGLVELQLEERGVSAGEYAAHIWRTLSETINEHLRQDGLPAVARLGEGGLLSPGEPQCVETLERFLANAPFVSVIVATRDRPYALFFVLGRKPVPNRAQSINYPKELDRAEIRGMLRGPLRYVQSLWALRGMRRAKR